MGSVKDDSPEARFTREVSRAARQLVRDAQASERERIDVERTTALDEKTARLRAARLAREAENVERKRRS